MELGERRTRRGKANSSTGPTRGKDLGETRLACFWGRGGLGGSNYRDIAIFFPLHWALDMLSDNS